MNFFRWLALFAVINRVKAGEAGFEMPLTLSGAAFFSNAPDGTRAGVRAVAYPSFRIDRHWYVSGAIQAHSRPYFYEQLSTQGTGIRADVLQAYLGYARYWSRNSIIVRTGMLSSAFGSFLLRYDDSANPLIDMPIGYGYYYKPVTTFGLPGAQVDVTLGPADFRAQFTASNPSNRRGIADHDQYGTWTGGAGWTVRQGYRLGASFYRGPYLHRQHRRYLPGELPPRDLPGSGYGLDAQIARGRWNIQSELMRFQRAYKVTPTFSELMVYGEARYVLSPRWFLAVRGAHRQANSAPSMRIWESGAGFRPAPRQIVKITWQIQTGPGATAKPDRVVAIQWVTTLAGPSAQFN